MGDGEITLALVGDLFVQRPEPESIFAHAGPHLREADIAFGNLEGVIADPRYLTEAQATRVFYSEERMLSAYTYAGIDGVGLANNHSMNQGLASLLRCTELLDEAGIAHAGGGRNLEEARSPAIIERNGTKVAFLAYSSVFSPSFAATADRGGIATVRVATSYEPPARLAEVPGASPIIHTHADPQDVAAMQEDVASAKERADVVVVSWHWGLSQATGGPNAGKILESQVATAHAAVDAGADLVMGHHPHVLEGIEVYNGRAVFYSLGNFASESNANSRETILVRCVIREGAIQRVSFIPTRINEQAQPVPVEPEAGRDIVELVGELSEPFDTLFQVGESEVTVEIPEGRVAASGGARSLG